MSIKPEDGLECAVIALSRLLTEAVAINKALSLRVSDLEDHRVSKEIPF